jgi:predicted permease
LLRKHLGFTAIAVVTLALGIGANTAIFSVIYSVLLRPLPFGEPDRIVQVWESRVEQGWTRASVAPANFWDFRDMQRTFEDLGTYQGRSVNLTGYEYPERLDGGYVSAGFFRILQVSPVLGRTFLPGEDQPGDGNLVALLGNEFWRSRFNADPDIIGTTLTVNDLQYTIVGVLPPGRPWLNYADIFMPYVRDPAATRQSFELAVIGRMKPDVTSETAHEDLSSVARRLEEQYPEEIAGIGVSIGSSSEWVANDDLRRALWILLGAVAFLLLIACVNLANMLLAKATGRMRETAVRAALGADRGRITRLVLTESLLLGLVGAAAGLLLAVWLIDVVRGFDPGGIPNLQEAGLNPWVLAFTIFVGVATGVLSGVVPAIQMPRVDFSSALREGDRGVSGTRGQKRLRSSLVAAEVALSLILLVGAGLLIRSFGQVMGVERGFQTDSRLIFAVSVPDSYDDAQESQLRRDFLERVRGVPVVRSAAAVSMRPVVGGSTGMGILPSRQPEEPDEDVPWATWRMVTPEYFRTMSIPLLRGRGFDERDGLDAESMTINGGVIISERLAARLFPGEDPIGLRVDLWRGQGSLEAEIIGVVGNMRERGLDRDPTLAVYLPYRGLGWSPNYFVVHAAGDPTAVVPTLRAQLAELDPGLPISRVQTLDELISDSVATRRFNMFLLAIFAGVALLLALAGIYGVQSYSVTRRTSEIGVRVAMGATPDRIIKQIIRQGMVPAVLGIVIGLIGAFILSRLMSDLLFGIAASDVITYAGVAVLLTVTALISCYLPALRALRIDPVIALREE